MPPADSSAIPLTSQDIARRRQELLEKARHHLREALSALSEASALSPDIAPAPATFRPNVLDPLPFPPLPSQPDTPLRSPVPAGTDNPFIPASVAGPKVNPFRFEFADGEEVNPPRT